MPSIRKSFVFQSGYHIFSIRFLTNKGAISCLAKASFWKLGILDTSGTRTTRPCADIRMSKVADAHLCMATDSTVVTRSRQPVFDVRVSKDNEFEMRKWRVETMEVKRGKRLGTTPEIRRFPKKQAQGEKKECGTKVVGISFGSRHRHRIASPCPTL